MMKTTNSIMFSPDIYEQLMRISLGLYPFVNDQQRTIAYTSYDASRRIDIVNDICLLIGVGMVESLKIHLFSLWFKLKFVL